MSKVTNKGIIQAINQQLFVSVLEVDGDFFAVEEFNPAENDDIKHFLRGKDITEIVASHPQFNPADKSLKDELQQKLDKRETITREWSKTYLWKMYLPG